MEVTGRRGRRRRQLLDDFQERRGYLRLKKGRTKSQYVGNSPWKRLCICHKADYEILSFILTYLLHGAESFLRS